MRGEETQLHGLPGQGKDPGNNGLGGDDGGQRGQDHHGIKQTVGNQMIKGVGGGLGIMQNQGALAEIIAEEGRQGHEIPGDADGL